MAAPTKDHALMNQRVHRMNRSPIHKERMRVDNYVRAWIQQILQSASVYGVSDMNIIRAEDNDLVYIIRGLGPIGYNKGIDAVRVSMAFRVRSPEVEVISENAKEVHVQFPVDLLNQIVSFRVSGDLSSDMAAYHEIHPSPNERSTPEMTEQAELTKAEQLQAELDELAGNLLKLRQDAEAAKVEYDKAYAEWQEQNVFIIDAKEETEKAVKDAETRARSLMVDLFTETGEKKFNAFAIRQTPTPEYDETLVTWLIDFTPSLAKEYLVVDKRKFDKWAKEQADDNGVIPAIPHIGTMPVLVTKKPSGVIHTIMLEKLEEERAETEPDIQVEPVAVLEELKKSAEGIATPEKVGVKAHDYEKDKAEEQPEPEVKPVKHEEIPF